LQVIKKSRVYSFVVLGWAILLLVSATQALASHSCAESGHINSQRTARLSWDENTETDLTGYRLYYGKQSGQHGTAIDVGNQTACAVSGLEPGIDYYFSVTAYDANQEESLPSNEALSSEKDKTAPAISGIRVTGITNSSAIITWDTNESTQGSLDYGTTAAFDRTFYSPSATNLHRATLNNLAASTTYFYRITTMDAAGNKATASAADPYFTTAPAQIPPVAYLIRVRPVGLSKRHAAITWKTNRPTTSRVEYGTTLSYGKVSEQKSPRVTTHTHVMQRLRVGTLFYFRIVGADSAGNVVQSTGQFKIVLSGGKPRILR